MRFVFVWMYFEAIFHILKPFGFLNTRRMWNGATILGPWYLSLTIVKIRHPHFFSCSHETCWKLLPHEVIIFTKFYRYQTTNVDFLLIANFWTWALFFFFDSDFTIWTVKWKFHTIQNPMIFLTCSEFQKSIQLFAP